MLDKTLTDFEIDGLQSQFCLADGHAYQDLHPCYHKIIQTLPEIWQHAASQPIPEVERQFSLSFSSLIQSAALANFKNFKICPTASNSIDLIAAVLNCLQLKTVLIEPAFDNLALLLRRRGVNLSADNDAKLFAAAESNELDYLIPSLKDYGALFLVNPNNPTGLYLSENAFKNIVTFCEKNGVLLLMDNSFRLYRRNFMDDYAILINSSVRFIAFEDTGKTWPTQDLKASLVYFSEDMAKLFTEIYNEVYLCVSNFSLSILAAFFDETTKIELREPIWDLVDARRSLLRKAIKNSTLSVSKFSINSNLPVEWLKCNTNKKNDLHVCQELKELGLAILPGRQFYWNSSNLSDHQQNIRISLMKPQKIFLAGLRILQTYCQKNSAFTDVEEGLAMTTE